MRTLIIIILLMSTICSLGCGKKQPKVIDPCANATICWGKQGELPQDNSFCRQVVACHDWEMRAQ